MSTTLIQTSNCSSPVLHAHLGPEERSGQVTLVLGNELRLEQAAQLRADMIEAFDKADDLALDVSEAQAVDLSFIQLICAAHRFAAASRKKLSWAGTMPSILMELLATAGVSPSKGCSGHDHCLWPERSLNEEDSANCG
jgi:anti-anti-sigma regulatory factor